MSDYFDEKEPHQSPKIISYHPQNIDFKYVCDGRVAYENICYTLPVYRPKNIAPFLIMSSPRLRQRKTPRFQTCERKIELNKKHHCVHTHNPCRGSRFEKVESCFAPSGHKGVERFEPRLTQLAYFGERFREGNIRYNETFTDRPSFQPPLSFASMEDILTETFLHIVQLRPRQSNMARYEKKNTWSDHSSLLFLYSM